MSKKQKIWRVATLNIQAGLSTHCYRDYFTKSWHHITPLCQSKQQNLISVANSTQHLDVFGVQEVDPGSVRSAFRNQAYWLAQYGKFDYWSYQVNRNTGLSVTANALFSRHMLHDVEHWTLPSRKSTPSPRGAVLSHIEDPSGKKWSCVVAHLSLNAQDRLSQSKFLAERLADHKHIILMGDFNDTPNSVSLAPLRGIMTNCTTTPTFPRWNPIKTIDVVWWKNIDVKKYQSVPWGSSDHCAVEMEFAVPQHKK